MNNLPNFEYYYLIALANGDTAEFAALKAKLAVNNLPNLGYYYAAALALSADKDEIAALKGRLNGFFTAPQLRCAAEARLAELEAPIIAAAKAKADIESDLMGLFS